MTLRRKLTIAMAAKSADVSAAYALEYAVQIGTSMSWVELSISLESICDQVVQVQLRDIGQHVSVYGFFKEGKKMLAQKM